MAMPNLQVGTFVLNMELLEFIVAGMIGVIAVRYRQRRHPERESTVSDAWSAVFVWLAVWKGSLFLFDPASVIDHPLSLLFFSGETKGMYLASVAACAYIGLRQYRRLGIRQSVEVTATWMAAMATGILAANVFFADSAGGLLLLGLFVSLAALIVLLSPSLKRAGQVLGLALVVTMIAYTVLDPADNKSIRDNQAAPDFRLTDLNGNAVSLSDYRGKTVLMNFWATWCRVCRTEMPHVEKLYQKYKDQDVVILSVNATSQERNSQRVKQYADEMDYSFPIVLDEAGDVLKQYKVTAYPTTYIIDPSGNIQERYLGAISYESMKKALRQ
ncbi:TlpA family protein disulfide reductase [Cohnella cholangitidis]|uniref:TlpA family protein disulfide reductase n=1 Tax=Cohnella cholangitidis TaxID=2598458 RepID=A0A7G5BYE8_9BACL|nr:TlpA disulfide reductase family protein [Cohnella cholangitidis]QMV41982.1 TlpA family protein disulfide reductase [Cohnella cholangitidis]